MRSVQYGSRLIKYSILERKELKSHYITVEKHSGVVLKGKPVSEAIADRLILKKARWILKKLEVVRCVNEEDIVTGSRIPYLGKTYYVQVVIDNSIQKSFMVFNHSKFIITVNRTDQNQEEVKHLIHQFYKEKAAEKISPRVDKFSQKTGLKFKGLQFRKMTKRWGSCTGKNRIIINTDAVKLPFSLIDYLIVHELVHTKVKDHSKRFWSELSKHTRSWKTLDERMKDLKM
jgi:predicted metal-dependent hydrolase